MVAVATLQNPGGTRLRFFVMGVFEVDQTVSVCVLGFKKHRDVVLLSKRK